MAKGLGDISWITVLPKPGSYTAVRPSKALAEAFAR
jgi:hypothetical protein